MTNTEGWIVILPVVLVVLGLFGVCSVCLIHRLLSEVKKASFRWIILAGLIIANWYVLMQFDAGVLIMGSFLLGIPASVLVPKFMFRKYEEQPPLFLRIVLYYFIVWGCVVLFLFFFSWSGLSMVFFWHTPITNGFLYLCLISGCIGLASLVYWLADRKQPANKVDGPA